MLSIESTDNPTPRAIAPAEVATADDLGRRVYATIEGGVQFDYVETYEDADGDGTQDADETGDAWYYWLVDESGRGVTVRSTRNPDDIYRYTATGVLVRDPGYMSEGVARFSGLEGTTDVQLEDIYYIEMRDVPQGKPQPIDLVDDLPAAGTLVTITGPSFGFFTACSTDLDGDGFCEDSEYDEVAWFVGDADAGRAITVLQADLPRTARSSFTGMLRSEAASILDAQRTKASTSNHLGSPCLIDICLTIRRHRQTGRCPWEWRSSQRCWQPSLRSDSSADTSCSGDRSGPSRRAGGRWDQATRSRSA